MKPVFAGSDVDAIYAAQTTLYRAFDAGLKLLSPFMPFITEELYQRLPKSNIDKVPSICVTDYPEAAVCNWRNESIEQEVDFVQKIAKAIRSARSDYNILNKVKTEGTNIF